MVGIIIFQTCILVDKPNKAKQTGFNEVTSNKEKKRSKFALIRELQMHPASKKCTKLPNPIGNLHVQDDARSYIMHTQYKYI